MYGIRPTGVCPAARRIMCGLVSNCGGKERLLEMDKMNGFGKSGFVNYMILTGVFH